ncbi:IS1595 family transposase [Fulvivirga sp.]|uniref:IS1595 family transposase n=1 Tax=Fulvivirga sp. TaxID=1931237 RepID=UPI0032EEE1FF
MNFKSLIELLDHFKDEATCISYYEGIRWGGNPVCPFCETEKPYKTGRGWKCRNKDCHKKFTVKVGTVFENSKLPLRTWFATIYLCTTAKKGISSVQLSNQLGVTQKTAWFLLHRVREMLKDKAPQMLGEERPVEVDETYIGGREKNRHYAKKRSDYHPYIANDGSPYKEKRAVVGIVERSGKVVLRSVPSASKKNMVEFIHQHVPKGSKIYTDEFRAYQKLGKQYNHATINHSLAVYVAGDVHTNTIENFWSVLKRGLYGIYHQVSEKHLERYLNEFASRYNTRNDNGDERFEHFLGQSEGRLKYKRLIAGL